MMWLHKAVLQGALLPNPQQKITPHMNDVATAVCGEKMKISSV
jgi:hypothetical protein